MSDRRKAEDTAPKADHPHQLGGPMKLANIASRLLLHSLR